jgi:hypothetical protein
MARVEAHVLWQLAHCPFFQKLQAKAEDKPNVQWENCATAGCDLGVTYDDHYDHNKGAFYVEGSCPAQENPS